MKQLRLCLFAMENMGTKIYFHIGSLNNFFMRIEFLAIIDRKGFFQLARNIFKSMNSGFYKSVILPVGYIKSHKKVSLATLSFLRNVGNTQIPLPTFFQLHVAKTNINFLLIKQKLYMRLRFFMLQPFRRMISPKHL